MASASKPLSPTILRYPSEALVSLVGYLEEPAAVTVSVNLDLEPALLPERYFVNIWHLLQESFSNIEKYSHAQNVSVALGVFR